jgi:diguanylate cyclase (GGDEF)-like protein/PAS domain S-box-containing protein
MRRLRFAGKIVVVSLVILVPLGALLGDLVATSGAELRLSETERAGVRAVLPLDRLLLELAGQVEQREGATPAGADRRDLGALLTELRQAGDDERLPRALREELAAYRVRVRDLSRSPEPPPVERLTQLLRDGVALVERVGDASHLSLDASGRTYYLQRVIVVHVPRLVAAAAELRARVGGWDRMGAADRTLLVGRAAVEVAVAAADLEHSVRQAMPGGVRPGDRRPLQVTAALVDRSDVNARSLQTAAAEPTVGAGDVSAAAGSEAAVDVARELLAGAGTELAGYLDDRIESARADRRIRLELTLGAVLLAAYLVVALWRSTSRDLRDVTADLEAAAVAAPLRRRVVHGRDELTTIARAAYGAHRRILTLVDDLQATTRQHQALVEHSSDITVVTDADGVVRHVSGSLQAVLGHDPDRLVGRNVLALVQAADRPALGAELRRVTAAADGAGEVTFSAPDARGDLRWLQARVRNGTADRHIGGVLWNVRDVTEEEVLARELRHRAYHDDLTGLPNRSLFLERTEQALRSAPAASTWTAVCMLDVDAFKGVNDALGHAAGDDLLRTVAQRLSSALREGGTAARLGGDEFGVLVADLSGPDAAIAVARRLRDVVATPVYLAGVRQQVTISVGVALAEPTDRPSIDQVLHEADVAMYVAKASGPGRLRMFEPGMLPAGSRTAADEVLALIADEHGIQPVFQPLMDLASGSLVGYEALARFPGREHRRVDEWFGLARRAGHGPALEAKAIAAALAVPGRPGGTYLTVNVSPTTLTSPAIARALPLDLHGIVIEVTEDSDIEGFELTAALDGLRARGARVAVDDAGSGYAGLRRLTSIRPDMIKLDRQLIQAVHEQPEKAALVEAMVAFCRRTSCVLVAEGIETLEELVTLADLDVGIGQGWVLGRPSASWPAVDREAAATCGAAYVTALGASDRRQEADSIIVPLRARLAAATCMADMGRALRVLAAGFGATDISFSWVEGGDLVSATDSGWGARDERYSLADYPASARCLAQLRPIQVRTDDPTADRAEVALLQDVGLGAVVLMPVAYDGEAIGLLEIYSSTARYWTRGELKLIHAAADSVAESALRVRAAVPPAAGVPAQLASRPRAVVLDSA